MATKLVELTLKIGDKEWKTTEHIEAEQTDDDKLFTADRLAQILYQTLFYQALEIDHSKTTHQREITIKPK